MWEGVGVQRLRCPGGKALALAHLGAFSTGCTSSIPGRNWDARVQCQVMHKTSWRRLGRRHERGLYHLGRVSGVCFGTVRVHPSSRSCRVGARAFSWRRCQYGRKSGPYQIPFSKFEVLNEKSSNSALGDPGLHRRMRWFLVLGVQVFPFTFGFCGPLWCHNGEQVIL